MIGTDLAALRAKRGLSIREVARRAGMSPSNLSEIERGLRDPQASTIDKIAEALGAAVHFRSDGEPVAVEDLTGDVPEIP